MTPEQWARVKEVFNAALAQETGRRAAFVADATAGDERVRSEVERLLDADLHAADFIEHSAAATLPSGRVISHYEIGHILGSGGMGRVYAARDTELGREVALKVASLDSHDAQARLRREAQHASRLSHPHICHIYDVGRDDGQLFIVMELVQGRSLADVIREGPLSIATARTYGIEIADALAHAHERGVTHRDLKSTNVMITNRGAKVLDFGLARMLDTHQIDALSHSQRSLTAAGLIAGTLPYMAPELLRGERGDQRADIWALGVLLYEMVGGRRPFTGGTGFELSAAILHQPPDTLPATVPAPMAAIIQRCLAKDPGDRYQQAADVHVALEEMKAASRIPRMRLPAIAEASHDGLPALLIGLAIAAVVASRIGSDIEATFSNARGYSLLAGRRVRTGGRSSFRPWPIASRPRRTPGTALARGTSRAACRTRRSTRTREHSPSSRRSSRRFSAGDWGWRRLAGTRKPWRTRRRISQSRRFCCRGSVATGKRQRFSKRNDANRSKTTTRRRRRVRC